ncbi:PQQ-binding-like beta-propeller repeat protein [Haloferula chungangensis]|uniref:PQQ-binding-like beta-propeller repeat protein n=1 Tax=Haloferula chungangensis TaxID=1048331 RepID=A0ABW2LBH7_9BACT
MKFMLISALLSVGHLNATNWSNWRGEEGAGVAREASPPGKVSSSQLWKAPLPGRGCSTPVVWEDLIVVTCVIHGKDGVLAYDQKGKEVWRHAFGKAAGVRHENAGSGCNPSALTDGKHIYVYFKSGTLAAVTMEGKEVWKRNLHQEYSPDGLKWDLGTSPIFAGGNVVVALLHNENPSFLLAFDKLSGKEVWKTPRDYDAPAEAQDAYTTPFVTEIDGVETIVTWGCDHLSGHDAKTGEELWKHGDFNPQQKKNWRVIASAVETKGIAIVPFGRGDHVAGVKLGGRGDTTGKNRLWTHKGIGSDSSTPVAKDGKFYVLNDKGPNRGMVTCLDAQTGKKEWQSKFPRSAAIYYASPLIAGDKIYAGRSDGVLFCGTITPKGLTDVVESDLEDTMIASPVAVGSKLFVRTHESLWCFE